MYPFQFDKTIDSDFLSTMYENDYGYIEKIFDLTISSFSNDILSADEKIKMADIEGVRKAIHKMKAAFGFIGMTAIQQNCQVMEEKCSSGNSFDEIKPELENLIDKIKAHSLILKDESLRLKIFNSTTL